MKYIIFSIFLFPITASADTSFWSGLIHEPIRNKNCFNSCPMGAPATNRLITRVIYTLSNNPNTKFSDWVAYKVTPQTIGKSKKRTWKPDPELKPENTLEPPDYKGAHKHLHTDRGHQAPLASFAGTKYWKQTNYLSNITPQKSALNQGAWVKLENKVRVLAKKIGAVWVMTGPLYRKEMGTLPGADEPHKAPSGYWKIVIVKTPGAPHAYELAAFIFPQTAARKDSFCKYISTVKEVSEASKLQFTVYGSRRNLLCTNKVAVHK